MVNIFLEVSCNEYLVTAGVWVLQDSGYNQKNAWTLETRYRWH